ncbi:hypothetical protein NBRC116600_02170 [Thalassotalea sp. SU-HH00458]
MIYLDFFDWSVFYLIVKRQYIDNIPKKKTMKKQTGGKREQSRLLPIFTLIERHELNGLLLKYN